MNESSSGYTAAPPTYGPPTFEAVLSKEGVWSLTRQCRAIITGIYNKTLFGNQTNTTAWEDKLLDAEDKYKQQVASTGGFGSGGNSTDPKKDELPVQNWSDIITPDFITTILCGIIPFIALMISEAKDKYIGVLLGTLLLYFTNFEPSTIVLASAGAMLFSNFARNLYKTINENKDKQYYEVAIDTFKEMRKNGIINAYITYENVKKTLKGEKSLKMLLPKILNTDSNPYLKLYVAAA